ncbi:MAG: hypothetical protein ACXVXC_05800 [Nocardioidaceae bacterium]
MRPVSERNLNRPSVRDVTPPSLGRIDLAGLALPADAQVYL